MTPQPAAQSMQCLCLKTQIALLNGNLTSNTKGLYMTKMKLALGLTLASAASAAIFFIANSASAHGYRQRQVVCQSMNYSPAYCYTGLRYTQNIVLLQQYSSAACVPGQTFGGYGQGNAMWVGGGCRGLFLIEGF